MAPVSSRASVGQGAPASVKKEQKTRQEFVENRSSTGPLVDSST
jgi:hypothetical protein